MNKCCVVYITHKEKLDGNEELSLKQIIKVFSDKRPIIVVIPNNISNDYYKQYTNINVCQVNSKWLSNYREYNAMCRNKEFYEYFINYDYILICQTDCWVFEDRLDYFISLGYDYYGAPWPAKNCASWGKPMETTVGNGGFSLRKVSKMIELTNKYNHDGKIMLCNEDAWYCFDHKNELNICDVKNACNFSFELTSKDVLQNIETYPMGLHGNFNTKFWDENGSKFLEYKESQLFKKISVITINFNNKDGLKTTIESVINQTVFNKNIEYIIIDGGSTDGSVDVIEKYKDKLHYYVSEKDNGIYEAMNKGVSHATSEYCLFLNSGDKLYKNDVIEQALPHLNEDVIYGNLLLNGKTKKLYPDNINVGYFSYESLPHPSSFIKTQLLRDNPYQTKYGIISDWIFFRESVAQGKKFKHIDLVVSDFYLGGASSNVKNVESEKKMYFGGYGFDYEICVIIPCYNQEKYVKETIDSLKASTYKDFHCIIVNDGSTDDSEKVIRQNIKNDKRFEYYKNENHGPGYSRNFGISKTNSKYILCLDSDDKISPTYIESGINYLNNHPNTSIFYGKANMFYDNGEEKKWDLPYFNYKSLLKRNMIYCSFIYRRKDYEKTGGYDENMKGFEDWDFLIRLLYDNDEVYRTNDIVFFYRQHDGSRDKTANKNREQYKNYIREKNKEIYNSIFQYENGINIYICANEKFKPVVKSKVYKVVWGDKIKENLIKDGLKNDFYRELYQYKFVNDNVQLGKYVGFCHYEKYFNFLDDIPDMDEIFSTYDVIVGKPIIYDTRTIKQDYANCHNVEDLYIVGGIIAEKYPEYCKMWNNFINGHIMIPYNMFIMKSEDFKEYIKFIFDILDEYVNIIGLNINRRIAGNNDKYIKSFSPNNTTEYQYRIGGYLAERLSNLFFMTHFKRMKTYSVNITEDKYGKEKKEQSK